MCWEQTALTRDIGEHVVQGAKESSAKMKPPAGATAQCSPVSERSARKFLLNSPSAKAAILPLGNTLDCIRHRRKNDMESSQYIGLCIYYKVIISTIQIIYYKVINRARTHFVKSKHTYTLTHTHAHKTPTFP